MPKNPSGERVMFSFLTWPRETLVDFLDNAEDIYPTKTLVFSLWSCHLAERWLHEGKLFLALAALLFTLLYL